MMLYFKKFPCVSSPYLLCSLLSKSRGNRVLVGLAVALVVVGVNVLTYDGGDNSIR